MLDIALQIGLDIDPNVVKPGWTPLLITLALAGVMVLLYRSMRRQFGRIQMPPKEQQRIPQDDRDAPSSLDDLDDYSDFGDSRVGERPTSVADTSDSPQAPGSTRSVRAARPGHERPER